MEKKELIIVTLLLLCAILCVGCIDEQASEGEVSENREIVGDTMNNTEIVDDAQAPEDFSPEAQPLRFESLEQLQDNASFEMTVPAYIPDEYELSEVILHRKSDGTAPEGVLESIGLRYENGNDFIMIDKRLFHDDSFRYQANPDDEIVKIGQYDAVYIAFTQTHALIWEMGAFEIRIFASSGKEEALKIANSMV